MWVSLPISHSRLEINNILCSITGYNRWSCRYALQHHYQNCTTMELRDSSKLEHSKQSYKPTIQYENGCLQTLEIFCATSLSLTRLAEEFFGRKIAYAFGRDSRRDVPASVLYDYLRLLTTPFDVDVSDDDLLFIDKTYHQILIIANSTVRCLWFCYMPRSITGSQND